MTDWLKTMGEMVVVTVLITAVLVVVPKVWGASRTVPEPVRVVAEPIAPPVQVQDTELSRLADQLAALNQHVFADEQRLKQIEMRLAQIQAAQVQLLETARKARTPCC